MRQFLIRAILLWLTIHNAAWSQTSYTWQQIKDKFETANPTLQAGRIGLFKLLPGLEPLRGDGRGHENTRGACEIQARGATKPTAVSIVTAPNSRPSVATTGSAANWLLSSW